MKTEMINLGVREDDLYGITAVEGSSKKNNKIIYPNLRLVGSEIDGLMDADLNDKLRLEIVVQVKEKRISDAEKANKKEINFDVISCQLIGKAGKKTKDEYNKLSEDEKEDYEKESVGLK